MRRLDVSITAFVTSLCWALAGAALCLILFSVASVLLVSPFIEDTNPAFSVVAFWAAGLGVIAGFCLGVNHGIQRTRTTRESRLTAR